MNTTRAKLFHAKLPKSFWSSAILSSAYVRNLIGPQGLKRTPHELFYGVRPDYSALRVYGSPAFVHIDQRANLTDHERGDLDWRAFPAIFIGYDPDSPAWLFWDIKAGKVRSASYFHATILEQHHDVAEEHFKHETVSTDRSNPDGTTHRAQISYDVYQGFDAFHDYPDTEVLQNVDEIMQSAASEPAVPNPSQDGLQQVFGLTAVGRRGASVLSIPACLAMLDREPKHYRQAIRGRDAETWRQSMQEEMESHFECGTFELVKKTMCDVRTIPLQWVYKIKQDEFGKPNRAKSRLVARGDRCAEGVHYSETFAPVVHFTSARSFLSTCCQEGWEIHQMDVNTAFVNSDLDRDNVFFNLPDGYAVHDDTGNDISSEYVLHGKRALYGLPQAPRLWNNRLTGRRLRCERGGRALPRSSGDERAARRERRLVGYFSELET